MMALLSPKLRTSLKGFAASSLMAAHCDLLHGVFSCLMYHRVVDDPLTNDPSGFHPNLDLAVTVQAFDQQMQYISDHFNCITLDEALANLREGRASEHSIVVTFDDGYRDNLTHALPILEKYRVPATIYVTTGIIDRVADLWWYEQARYIELRPTVEITVDGVRYRWALSTPEEKRRAFCELNDLFKRLDLEQQGDYTRRMRKELGEQFDYERQILTWEEVQQLSIHPLVTIGAHTVHHPALAALSPDLLVLELTESKQLLQRRIGKAVCHLSYPFGQKGEASLREFEAAQRCGYSSATTTRFGHVFPEHRDHCMALPRIFVSYFDDFATFKSKLSGIESLLHYRTIARVVD